MEEWQNSRHLKSNVRSFAFGGRSLGGRNFGVHNIRDTLQAIWLSADVQCLDSDAYMHLGSLSSLPVLLSWPLDRAVAHVHQTLLPFLLACDL